MVSGEDDPEDTLVPRLIAAGGDRSRVHFLEGTRCVGTDGKQFDRAFTLSDINTIEDGLRQAGDARLVIIDPVSAYLNDTDAHRNEQVRALLSPLAALAAARGTAIVLITHLAKAGASALYRAIGSIGFVAAARAGWVFGREKGDPERRVMVALKNNLAADQGGLGYTLATVPVELQGRRTDVVRVCWQPVPVNVTADQLLESESAVEHTERMEAVDWLMETLGGGGVEAKEVKHLAMQCGLSWSTVRRAADHLGVRHRREGFGPGSRVFWELSRLGCSPEPIGVIDAQHADLSKYGTCEHVCGDAPPSESHQTADTVRSPSESAEPSHRAPSSGFQEGEL
jgi:putative DNA primase/helicase